MNLLIIGATGGTGRQLVRQALDQGHAVTAFVRRPSKMKVTHERLTIHQGNILNADSVDSAVKGHDAVLCALGHKRWFIKTTILSEGTRNLLRAMEHHGVRRLICETSLGVGDTWGKLGLYHTLFVIPVIIWFYFRDKERQERLIKESTLDWTIVRPAQLTNGKHRRTYRHGSGIGNYVLTQWISRADVADFMLKQLTDTTYLRQTPGVAY